MPRGAHRDRIKKSKQDEGSSGEPTEGPCQSFREWKRPPDNDDIEGINANTDSENDSEDHPNYEARRKDERRLGDNEEVDDDDSDEEGDGDSDDGNGNDDGRDDEDLGDPPAIRPPIYTVDYSKEKMVGAVKRNRSDDPYGQPKFNGDQGFGINFSKTIMPRSLLRSQRLHMRLSGLTGSSWHKRTMRYSIK